MLQSDKGIDVPQYQRKFHVTGKMNKRLIQKFVNSNFSPLNTYFWFHLVGFQKGMKFKKGCILQTAISFAFAILNESFTLLSIFCDFKQLYQSNTGVSKAHLLVTASFLFEMLLRIFLYVKRNEFNKINKRLAAIYIKTSRGTELRLKLKLSLTLLISDLTTIVVLILYCYDMNIQDYIGDTGNEYFCSFIPARHFTKFLYFSQFILHWSLMTTIVPIYFCCYCYVLKEALEEMKRRLRYNRHHSIERVYPAYDEILNLIPVINKTFHVMLPTTFGVLLGWVFYESYRLAFMEMNSARETAFRVLFLIASLFRFTAMCLHGSTVIKIASEVKDIIFNLPSEVTTFILKIRSKFVGFTLFDSLVINKGLILTSLGNLVTYGIIIATFSVNTSISN